MPVCKSALSFVGGGSGWALRFVRGVPGWRVNGLLVEGLVVVNPQGARSFNLRAPKFARSWRDNAPKPASVRLGGPGLWRVCFP